jgi:hypothetical protein
MDEGEWEGRREMGRKGEIALTTYPDNIQLNNPYNN